MSVKERSGFRLKTLLHEEIYVYVEKVEEVSDMLSGSTAFNFSNDATNSIVDPGVLTITCQTGSYTSLDVDAGFGKLTIGTPLSANDVMVLDFRERHYTLNGSPFLLEDILTMKDDTDQILTVTFSGSGTADVTYNRNQVITNNMDLYYCTGIDVNESTEINQTFNIKGENKIRKTAKKDYKWSINGLCNETELQKFESGTGLFRLRLVDEDGTDLETLANCVISSFQKGSSETGDYTYSLNGSAEKIYD